MLKNIIKIILIICSCKNTKMMKTECFKSLHRGCVLTVRLKLGMALEEFSENRSGAERVCVNN